MRSSVVLLVALSLGAAGCFSLPPPDPDTKAVPGQPAPGFALAATPGPGKLALEDLTKGTSAVLVFYRGDW